MDPAGPARRAPYHGLGGFPEEHHNLFYSCDNASIAGCAAGLGHRIYVDNANECRLLDHGDLFPKPPDWEERHGRYGARYRWFEGWMRGGRSRFPHLPGRAADAAGYVAPAAAALSGTPGGAAR